MHIATERDRDAKPCLVAQRAALESRLDDEGRGDLSRPLEQCGWMKLFRCTCCGSSQYVAHRCKKRWCPVCASLISARLVDRYRATMGNVKWPLFVTWTATHTQADPIPGFAHMFDALKRLRRMQWFADRVRGGIVSGEVSNSGGNGWHVHLHSIIDTVWLAVSTCPPPYGSDPQTVRRRAQRSMAEVGEQWSLQVQRRASVQSQRCSGPDAVREVLKYAVKPADLIESPDPIGPIIDLMARTRLVRSWGCMYGHLRDADVEAPPRACDRCGESAPIVPDDVYEAARRSGTCG